MATALTVGTYGWAPNPSSYWVGLYGWYAGSAWKKLRRLHPSEDNVQQRAALQRLNQIIDRIQERIEWLEARHGL